MDFLIGLLLLSIVIFAFMWKYKPDWLGKIKSFFIEKFSFLKKEKKNKK